MPALNAFMLPQSDRIRLAKERTGKLVDHVRASLEMHEANSIVVYSRALADQIPASYAAHAFNQFQRSMLHFEIVRLCALWDGSDADKENVPTVVELVDDAAIVAELANETRAHWANRPARLLNPEENPEMQKAVEDAIKRSEAKWAEEQAGKAAAQLQAAIASAKTVMASPRLQAVLNLRHKHLAHSLSQTSLERKGTVHPMKYGDEQWLFEETLRIVDGLHISINGAAFMWDDARRIARRNAESLWKSCTFTVTE